MLFVDSCDPLAVQEIFAMGIAHGVTTNPIILAKRTAELGPAPLDYVLASLWNASRREDFDTMVFAQLTETDESKMVHEAETLAALAESHQCSNRLGIKVPFSEVGLRVAHRLLDKDFTVNLTSIMSPAQAYVAACMGVPYVSVFMGRIQDMGLNPCQIIQDAVVLLARGRLQTRIIAGSIRQPRDILDAQASGALIQTASPEILKKLLYNPQTERTNAEFQRAAEGL
jgi:transaldolase